MAGVHNFDSIFTISTVCASGIRRQHVATPYKSPYTDIMRTRYSAEIPPQRLYAIIAIHLFLRSAQVQDEPMCVRRRRRRHRRRPKNTLVERDTRAHAYVAVFGRWLTDVELMMRPSTTTTTTCHPKRILQSYQCVRAFYVYRKCVRALCAHSGVTCK